MIKPLTDDELRAIIEHDSASLDDRAIWNVSMARELLSRREADGAVWKDIAAGQAFGMSQLQRERDLAFSVRDAAREASNRDLEARRAAVAELRRLGVLLDAYEFAVDRGEPGRDLTLVCAWQAIKRERKGVPL